MIIPWKRVKLSGFAFTPDKRFTLSTHFQKTPIEARIQYSQNEMRLIIVLVPSSGLGEAAETNKKSSRLTDSFAPSVGGRNF